MERDFAPFGERIKTNDREELYPDETEDGFTGKDWDDDVGLYYYNARWYDASIGRFISKDSIADDPNLYGYCGQNPINNIDPSGHVAQGLNAPISFGLKSGWGLAGAVINAGAILSGDSTLGLISSAFSLFVTIKNWKEAADEAAYQAGLAGLYRYMAYMQEQEGIPQDEASQSKESFELVSNNNAPDGAKENANTQKYYAIGERKLQNELIEKGYTVVGVQKNVNATGVDIAAYKDGVLYLIDVKESIRSGKIIYSCKGFQNPFLFDKWIAKISKELNKNKTISSTIRSEIEFILNDIMLNSDKVQLIIATTDVEGENIVGIGPKLQKGVKGMKVTFMRSLNFSIAAMQLQPVLHTHLLSLDIYDMRAGKFGAYMQMKLDFVETHYRNARVDLSHYFTFEGFAGNLNVYRDGIEFVNSLYNGIWANMY